MNTETGEKRFIVDQMLGKTAKWLRVLGFDTRYECLTHEDQLDGFRREGFTVITRNRRWSGHSCVLSPASNDPMEQLAEIISTVPITLQEIHLLHRCILCNRRLEQLPKDRALGHVPDHVYETNVQFVRCPGCRRIYWHGSHPRRMSERLQRLSGWDL
jgi:uncharacterized protein